MANHEKNKGYNYPQKRHSHWLPYKWLLILKSPFSWYNQKEQTKVKAVICCLFGYSQKIQPHFPARLACVNIKYNVSSAIKILYNLTFPFIVFELSSCSAQQAMSKTAKFFFSFFFSYWRTCYFRQWCDVFGTLWGSSSQANVTWQAELHQS